MPQSDFTVTDRRSAATQAARSGPSGLILGESVASAKNHRLSSPAADAALSAGRAGPVPTDLAQGRQMRMARMNKAAGLGVSGGNGGTSNLSFASQRPHDPFFYWQQNNLPYDFNDPRHLVLLRQLCRHIYKAHSVMASAIDIYAKWPLLGMEFECKDKALVDFYSELFFDQLDYEEYLPSVLHEYWVVGEAFPLGSFNEMLGVWENDELLNPDDVFVEKNPFIKDPNLFIRLPESLRKILTTGQPPEQYHSLMRSYPELRAYAQENTRMPVSNVLLKHLMFRGDNFSTRGLPIMYRALRPLMQEEMLNAAQDAIADRLYTPLILAKLGASATDLGTDEPWVPTEGQIANFEQSLDAALAADFRVLTTHFAVDMSSVFGRETMPNFDADFDRMTEKQLQAFGLSKTMLSGAGCLTGDMLVHVNRGKKGFRMRLEDLVARFNGTDAGMPGRKWDTSIPTYVSQAQGQVVRLGLLDAAWSSGIKPVFHMTTTGGREIRASATHPFLTEDGRWVELGDLRVGDTLQVNDARDFERREVLSKPQYLSVGVKYHPNQVSRGTRNGMTRYTVPLHRLVMEAALNNLKLYEIKAILNNDSSRSKELVYLPEAVEVHHRDEDPSNNALENLQVLTQGEHKRHHAAGSSNFVLWRIGTDTIVSIEPDGEEETFDLRMAGEPHNFIANGFVVHNSGETYAADALNRDLVSQLLGSAQRYIRKFTRDRMLVVAEAQEHFDYETRGGKRYPIMEEVLEVDEESGEQRIVEQPKLLVPDLKLATMNMRDDEQERAFLESLRASGVPISMKRRLVNIDIELDKEIEQTAEEQVEQAVEAQRVRKDTYLKLRAERLPIPADLKADFEPKPMNAADADPSAADPTRTPQLGLDGQDTSALAPTPEVQMTPPGAPLGIPAGPGGTVDPSAVPPPGAHPAGAPGAPGGHPGGNVIPLPRNKMMPGAQPPGATRPPESDEMRARMPKATHLHAHVPAPPILKNAEDQPIYQPFEEGETPQPYVAKAGGIVQGPRHINLRRHAGYDRDTPIGDDPDSTTAEEIAEEG